MPGASPVACQNYVHTRLIKPICRQWAIPLTHPNARCGIGVGVGEEPLVRPRRGLRRACEQAVEAQADAARGAVESEHKLVWVRQGDSPLQTRRSFRTLRGPRFGDLPKRESDRPARPVMEANRRSPLGGSRLGPVR